MKALIYLAAYITLAIITKGYIASYIFSGLAVLVMIVEISNSFKWIHTTLNENKQETSGKTTPLQ